MIVKFALPYARAVFELAEQSQSLEAWRLALAKLSVLDAEVLNLLSDPSLSLETKLGFLAELGDKQIEPEFKNFLSLVLKKKLKLLGYIYRLYLKFYYQAKHITYISLKCPNSFVIEPLKVYLEAKYGKIELEVKYDQSLLAGFILRVGEETFDYSLAGHLNLLARDLVEP